MTANQESFQLLDQLQNEINRVLEQTGRLFAAAKDDPKTVPVVQITKLKQILPDSIDRFHNALDQLEDELQTAKIVMRRDLALCRERAGIQLVPQIDNTINSGEPGKSGDAPDNQVITLDEPEKTLPVEDVSMQDAEPSQPAEPEKPVDENAGETQDSADLQKQDSAMDDQPTNQYKSPKPSPPDQIRSESTLQIDTQTQPKDENNEGNQADEDRAPDTGMNTNDLDSLFGGPTSAGPGDGTDFQSQFDFGDFDGNLDNNGADNDNISALLPGLQDYANTQPTGSGEPDFDALFSTDLHLANDAQDGDQQDSGQHRDSTFDDLLNFADFNAGDFAAGTGGGTSNANANVNEEFDFSFD